MTLLTRTRGLCCQFDGLTAPKGAFRQKHRCRPLALYAFFIEGIPGARLGLGPVFLLLLSQLFDLLLLLEILKPLIASKVI